MMAPSTHQIITRLSSRVGLRTGADRHTEEMLFLRSGNRRYFAVRYEPGPDIRRRPVGIVQIHSFGFEQVSFRPLETRFARSAVSLGYPILYVQAQGYGDSDGDLEDATIATHVRDVTVALERAPELLGTARQIVQGIRLGCLTGAAAASTRSDVEGLIMWQPVADPMRFFRRMLRARLIPDVLGGARGNTAGPKEQVMSSQAHAGAIDVLGFPILPSLIDEAQEVRIGEFVRSAPDTALLAQVGRPGKDLVEFEAALIAAGCHVDLAEVSPHPRLEFAPAVPLKSPPEAQGRVFRRLIDVTTSWLTVNHGRVGPERE